VHRLLPALLAATALSISLTGCSALTASTSSPDLSPTPSSTAVLAPGLLGVLQASSAYAEQAGFVQEDSVDGVITVGYIFDGSISVGEGNTILTVPGGSDGPFPVQSLADASQAGSGYLAFRYLSIELEANPDITESGDTYSFISPFNPDRAITVVVTDGRIATIATASAAGSTPVTVHTITYALTDAQRTRVAEAHVGMVVSGSDN
jgi:hypothetical protein